MKACLGVTNLSQINLLQSTFSLLNLQISQAELQEYSPVWDDVHLSLSLSWITTWQQPFCNVLTASALGGLQHQFPLVNTLETFASL